MIDSNENYPLTIIDLCLAEGTTVLTAQALSGRIEEDWPRLMQLLNQFKPPSSTTTSSTNNSSSESEWIEQFAKTIQADLECVRSVYKSHFHQSSATAVSPWKFPLFSINQTAVERQQASERLCTAYYAERLASIRCLIRLIASAMQESHWFHSSAIALVERHRQDLIVLFQTSVKQLTAQFSHLSTPGRSQQRQALAQTLREILLLTELIYWLSRWTGTLRTERLDFSSVILPVINQLLSAAFSPKLQFLVTSAGKPMIEESLENWRAVCVFTVAELLQLNRLNYSAIIPIAVLQPRDCIQLAEILQSSLLPPVAQGANSTVPDKLAGLLLLAGASLFSHISDNIPTSASSPDWMELQCNANGPVELFRLLAQKAFQSGVLEALPAMLNSDSGVFCRTDLFTVEPIGESQQAFLVVICRILFWFTRQFDLTQLNGAEDLFAGALNALLRKSPAVRKLIISQRGAEDAHTLRSSWESAAAQFPLSFIRFAQLNECLMLLKTEDSVSDLAIKASAALLNMPTVAQDAQQIDPEHVQHLGDGLVRSSKPLTIGVGPFATLTIPAGTDGQYTTLPSGEAIVRWNFQFSVWDLMMDWMAVAGEKEPAVLEQTNGLVLLRYVVRLIRRGLASYSVTGMQVFGEERGQLFRTHYWPILMDQLSSLFDRLSRYALSISGGQRRSARTSQSLLIMEDILVGCIQAIAEFISMDRDGGESDRIWPFLKQANLVRLQGGSHSSAAGHLSRLRQIHEAPSGQYRITSAFIRLLLMLVRRMRFQADIDSPLSGDALLLTSGYLVHFTTDICGVSGGGSAGGSHSSSSFIGWPVRSLQTRQRLCKDVQAIWREILGDNPMAPLLASVGQQQLSSLAKWGHCIYQSALAPLLWLPSFQSNSNSICSNQPATSAFLLAMLSPVSPTQLPVSGIPRSFTEEVLQLLKSLLLIRQSLGPEHLPRSAVDRLLLQPVQSADGKPLIAVLGSYISLPWGTLVPIVSAQLMAQYVHTLRTCTTATDRIPLASHFDASLVFKAISERLDPKLSAPVVSVQVPLILFITECFQSQARLAEIIIGNDSAAVKQPSTLVDQIAEIVISSSTTAVTRPVLLAACLRFLKTLWTLTATASGAFRPSLERLRTKNALICDAFSAILMDTNLSIGTPSTEDQQQQLMLRQCHMRIAKSRVLSILAAECRQSSALGNGKIIETVRRLLKRLLDNGTLTEWISATGPQAFLMQLELNVRRLAAGMEEAALGSVHDMSTFKTLLWSTAIDSSLQYGPRFAYTPGNVNAAAAAAGGDYDYLLTNINLQWSQLDSCQQLLTGWTQLVGVLAVANIDDDLMLPPDLADYLLDRLQGFIDGKQRTEQPPLLRATLLTPLLWLYSLLADRQERRMKIIPTARRSLKHFHQFALIFEALDRTAMIAELTPASSSSTTATAGAAATAAAQGNQEYYRSLWIALNSAISALNRQPDGRLEEAAEGREGSGLVEQLFFVFSMGASCLHDLPVDAVATRQTAAAQSVSTSIIAVLAGLLRIPLFLRQMSLWEPAVRQFDLINRLFASLLAAFNSGAVQSTGDQQQQQQRAIDKSLLTATMDLINQLANHSSVVCRQLVDGGVFEVLRCLVERDLRPALSADCGAVSIAAHQSYLQLLALFDSILKTAGPADDRTVFNSFQLLDSLWPRISDTFSAVSGVPVVESDLVYGGMPAAGAMLLLDELELSARLFYQLIGSYSSWKRRRPELSGRYLRLCLPVLRQLVDWLSHPNRFSAAQANANGADSSKETDGSIQLLSIVECLLSTIYVLTYAWQPFQCRQDDWDAPIAVFVPSLTITAPSDPMVALGTLNSLLAYCCKDNPAGQKSADQRKLANRLLATAELAMTLFITQTVYSLSSPLVDPRQREQIRLEIGGELAAAVDAFASKGSGEYFSRLRSYVQRIK